MMIQSFENRMRGEQTVAKRGGISRVSKIDLVEEERL